MCAVERLGALLADPGARERIRTGLKRFLDRAIKNLMVHERVMAKLVQPECDVIHRAQVAQSKLHNVLDAVGLGLLRVTGRSCCSGKSQNRVGLRRCRVRDRR